MKMITQIHYSLLYYLFAINFVKFHSGPGLGPDQIWTGSTEVQGQGQSPTGPDLEVRVQGQ
jgi:hypothetical protein